MQIEAGKTGKARGISTYNKLDKEQLIKIVQQEKEKSLSIVVNNEHPIPTCIKTKKLYFAGPWFNEKSNMFYDAILDIAKECEPFTDYDIFFPKLQANKLPFDAFIKNVSNIKECDMLVAFVDDKDVGTAWEIGMAYALNKPIILIGLDDSTFLSHTNVMLAFTGECSTLSEFSKILIGKNYKTINFDDTWEGIE